MKLQADPAIVLIGSVNSSRKTLEKLIEHKMNVVGILCLDPEAAKNVSGYNNLKEIAEKNKIPFQYFVKVNSKETIQFVSSRKVDFLFVIGLSQMVHKQLLSIPKYGCVGFHPTRLPQGRGRAALAWIVLGMVKGAATFFQIEEGIDSGPIWIQETFETNSGDYAEDVLNKILKSIDKALDKVLPQLKNGEFDTVIQNESKATYLAKRNPEDGLIKWDLPAQQIYRQIRALSYPLPGAYTYAGLKQVHIFRASVSNIKNYLGVIGRVVVANDIDGILVQTGEGLLKLEEFEGISKEKLKIGFSLGLKVEKELLALAERIETLEKINESHGTN